MTVDNFAVFDLGAFEKADENGRKMFGDQVDRICRESGFLAITNHGVDPEIISNIWQAVERFFDQPYETKNTVRAPYPGYPYGYLGPGTEALAKSRNVDSPPDLKESFNGGPAATPSGISDPEALSFCYQPTLWPDQPDGFKEAWQTYYSTLEKLAARIMRVFAAGLDLPLNYFEPFIDQPISALRALNYPEQLVPPLQGQLRAGAHTDYGSLTILLPQTGSKGLEIQMPDGEWLGIPPVPGAFIINIGDLMARWTNDRWVSTLHRVVNPSAEEGGMKRRMSLAYFHQPNWNAEITCLPSCLEPGETPRYAPVLSGPYLMSKFKSTVTAKM